MEKLIKFVQSLPKPVLIFIVVIVFALLGYGTYYAVFGSKKDKKADTVVQKLNLDFPDAAEVKVSNNKLDELKRMEGRNSSVNEYWSSLGDPSSEDEGGLKTGPSNEGLRNDGNYFNGIYLDPSVYSEYEIYSIKKGLSTKEEIDAQHAELKSLSNSISEENKSKENKEANSDSLYFARMEKAYQLAMKYSSAPDAAQPTVEAAPSEPEPKKIEVTQQSIPSATLISDDIISSLESPKKNSDGAGVEEFTVTPVKATFMKNEKLVSGQRVIMRLKQDLHLSDGTLIPMNTHISGTCKIGNRLNISVSTVSYGGKIYYTDLDIYDNDGTEGIYCPVIVNEMADKSAKRVAKKVGNTAVNSISAMISLVNPSAGYGFNNSVSEISQIIDGKGNITVSVSSGYEFYIFENVDKKKK